MTQVWLIRSLPGPTKSFFGRLDTGLSGFLRVSKPGGGVLRAQF